MITHIQYFGCDGRPEWEEKLQNLFLEARQHRPVAEATARVEEPQNATYRYRIHVNLKIPGASMALTGDGYTFNEALMEATAMLRHKTRRKPGKPDGASIGVKATHRG